MNYIVYLKKFKLQIIFLSFYSKGCCYFTMAITVERYLVICQPFYRNNCSYSPKAVIAFIVCFSIVYNIPKFFEIEPVSTKLVLCKVNQSISEVDIGMDTKAEVEENNITYRKLGYRIGPTTLMRNPIYNQIYLAGLNIVFNGLIPFFLIIILNSFILRQLIRQNSLEEVSPHRKISSRKNTVTSLHSMLQGINKIYIYTTTYF